MVHSQEELVKKFMSFDKKSSDRKNAIAVIRKKGNFDLFVNKDLNKDKYFVPSRRPTDKSKCSAENYAVCPDCNGLYT
ncbi:GSCOCG00010576001-RA-CDS, partial [Cotesia congregata]